MRLSWASEVELGRMRRRPAGGKARRHDINDGQRCWGSPARCRMFNCTNVIRSVRQAVWLTM